MNQQFYGMKESILILGAVILVLSIFGYSYAGEQQGLIESAEGAIQGEDTDWSVIASVSMAGIALGIVLVVVGLVPDNWYDRGRST